MENNRKHYRILIVDDEIEYQKVVSLILEDAGYQTATCSNGQEALDFLKKNDVNLVITDLRMPVMTGSELSETIRRLDLDVDVLVVTAYGSIEGAVDAIRLGASDYFVKSRDLDELIMKVDRIAKMKRLEHKNDILLKNQNVEDVFMESKNSEYRQLIDMCNRTADTNINILLLGESGVGKEVIANYIHRISDRANEPFIPVNCQVFPEGVIESELFGHEKGSFTGAVGSRIGKFEEANYGTLFLDEIGDLPITTQGKLLRALETRSIERIGSNKRIHLDVRFIFATNKDLNKEIEKGVFRDDLLYRINTLTLTIPPLRQRREDLPGLIEFFVRKTEIDQKKKDIIIEDDVMEHLLHYDYPGNIRELKNMIERMIALSRGGRVTMEELMLPGRGSYSLFGGSGEIASLREARGEFEKKYIREALRKNDWNVEKCAGILGITSRQLWNKISQYDLHRGES
ncbi:MAG: sigma-54-dependent Fis family transcriptional regulator [Firmicutes bacterium]|nr:sigma-54-dependent Fis family transcriptional regulator [Bacillota bacterium]